MLGILRQCTCKAGTSLLRQQCCCLIQGTSCSPQISHQQSQIILEASSMAETHKHTYTLGAVVDTCKLITRILLQAPLGPKNTLNDIVTRLKGCEAAVSGYRASRLMTSSGACCAATIICSILSCCDKIPRYHSIQVVLDILDHLSVLMTRTQEALLSDECVQQQPLPPQIMQLRWLPLHVEQAL